MLHLTNNFGDRSNTVAVDLIETKPRRDAHLNIDGMPTQTWLYFDPAYGGKIRVVQKNNDGSNPDGVNDGRILALLLEGNPLEYDMGSWLADHKNFFHLITYGYDLEWDGDRYVGSLTTKAMDLWKQLLDKMRLFNMRKYIFISRREFIKSPRYNWVFCKIKALTSDAKLEEMAREQFSLMSFIVDGVNSSDDLLPMMVDHRAKLKAERKAKKLAA